MTQKEYNLGIIMADAKENLNCIRVRNKTLTATNGRLMVRRCIELPDGDYQISDGQLIRTLPLHWYPEEAINHFPKRYVDPAQPCSTLTPETRGQITGFVHQFKKEGKKKKSQYAPYYDENGRFWEDSRIRFDSAGVWYFDHQNAVQEGIQLPLNLPFPLDFPAHQIIVAMNELHRYDNIHVLKSLDREHPLILGLNWGSCVLIMPYRMENVQLQPELERVA